MRSLGTRRAVEVAGAATVAVIALAGCSAGQTAETSLLKTPVSGLNTQSPDGGLLIRDLQVDYSDPAGYKAGDSAQLEVSLFNQTENPITVSISSQPSSTQGIVSAQQIGVMKPVTAPATTAPAPAASVSSSKAPKSSASASISDSASPTTPPSPAPTATAAPAQFTIQPLSSETFLPGGSSPLTAIGLSGQLVPGGGLSLVFQISGQSQALDVTAPVAIPTSPAARASGVPGENNEDN